MCVAGLILAAAVGAGFAWWIQAFGDWNAGLPWERELMLSLHTQAPQVIDWIMLALPWLGTNLTLAPVIGAFSLWVWLKRGRGDIALELMITVLGGLILNLVLKDLFDRARPQLWEHRGQYAYAAYPSGHAIVGVAVFYTVARLLHREQGWRWPFVAASLLLAVSLYSRLYLGVHWPTDVIGGVLIGSVWLAALVLAFRSVARRRQIPGEPRSPVSSQGASQLSSRGASQLSSRGAQRRGI